MPEIKKGLKKKERKQKLTLMGGMQRGIGAKRKKSQWPKLEQFEQHKVLLDNFPKRKINIYDSIFM